MMVSKFIVIFCFFVLSITSCARYYLGNVRQADVKRSSSDLEVSYELIGWDQLEQKKYAAKILKGLHESHYFKRISSHVKSSNEQRLQIILSANQPVRPFFGEHTKPVSMMLENKPGTLFLNIVNRILFIRTLFLIPMVMPEDRIVTFRFWRKNMLVEEHTYSLETLSMYGWVPLGLRFFDDDSQIKTMYEDISHSFIQDLGVGNEE